MNMQPITLSPEDKKRSELQRKTEEIHREHLRQRLEIRIQKAEANRDWRLLAQLKEELNSLR
jgi:hypothetical protein